ncbi:sulfotransferase family 2 domain-containing protein [uncultured Algibacter sp.]|uniref:sulfotransferase family 2 domain-containing protein n=1 Tax=uncultured Algibacter sp. TaxID=298659 RepID=UPI002613919C|nr:sulfotransferase family 2 domain-containing protein [uncultured Algibacter sp.]
MILSFFQKSSSFKKYHRKLKVYLAANFYNNKKYLPKGIDRVYHLHIRKSAGTSINSAFWGLDGFSLNSIKAEPIFIGRRHSYVRKSKTLIDKGDYLYASSHFPQWQLNLKPNTFTFTMFRDPYKRLVSLYKYYCWVTQVDEVLGRQLDPSYLLLKKQEQLLNKSFKDFIDNLSDKYLYNQLFTFSKSLQIDEAVQNLQKVNKVYFQDNFDASVTDLSKTLNLNLNVKNERSFQNVAFQISEEEREYALEKLSPELEFYKVVRDNYYSEL